MVASHVFLDDGFGYSDASYREEAYVKVWWNQTVESLKCEELRFYVMGIVKSLT